MASASERDNRRNEEEKEKKDDKKDQDKNRDADTKSQQKKPLFAKTAIQQGESKNTNSDPQKEPPRTSNMEADYYKDPNPRVRHNDNNNNPNVDPDPSPGYEQGHSARSVPNRDPQEKGNGDPKSRFYGEKKRHK